MELAELHFVNICKREFASMQPAAQIRYKRTLDMQRRRSIPLADQKRRKPSICGDSGPIQKRLFSNVAAPL
jgi:hypothetical protein